MSGISIMNSINYMLETIKAQRKKINFTNFEEINKETCNKLNITTSEGMEFIGNALQGNIGKEDYDKHIFMCATNEYYEYIKSKESSISEK